MNSQSKKTFKLILLSTLLFVTRNNLFSKNVEIEETKKQKESPSQIYYKQNPWAFIERELISAPNAKSSSWLQALIKTGVFSGASIGTCVGTWIILEHCNLKKYLPYNLQYKDTLEMMSVFVGLISGILSVVFYCRWLKPFTNLQSLKNFLDNYNPNLEKLGVNNNKRYIPEELHETFDALYEGYQKEDGDVFLKKEGFEVLRVVMEKIIYQINPKKYELPTQFYTTSYPVVINNQSGNSPIATGVGNAIGSNLGNYLSRKLFK